ncbi:peptidyl-prolyl cis-trans isomerase [Candidatus Bipolaricaulota bacterium]|nr:peptidyl-prolyl cis-trans isomerase [Candidatus Bipolaricaulota bacterium]
MNFSKRYFVIFSLVLLLITPSIGLLAQDAGSGQQNQPTVVATVNGAEVTQQELSQSSQTYQIMMTLSRQFRSFAQFMMSSQKINNLELDLNDLTLNSGDFSSPDALIAQIKDELSQTGLMMLGLKVGDEFVTQYELEHGKNVTLDGNQLKVVVETTDKSALMTGYRLFVLERLIETEIQNQKTDNLGIEVSKEEVQKQVENIIENNDQFEDEKSLKDYLEKNQNMSLDDLKTRIRENLRQQKLKQEVTGKVEVTEDEMTSFYEENKGNYTDEEGNVKPFEEVKDQIEGTLKNQKTNKAWNEWLQTAKEEARIEKKLENL